jgi:hypothetical protein
MYLDLLFKVAFRPASVFLQVYKNKIAKFRRYKQPKMPMIQISMSKKLLINKQQNMGKVRRDMRRLIRCEGSVSDGIGGERVGVCGGMYEGTSASASGGMRG